MSKPKKWQAPQPPQNGAGVGDMPDSVLQPTEGRLSFRNAEEWCLTVNRMEAQEGCDEFKNEQETNLRQLCWRMDFQFL